MRRTIGGLLVVCFIAAVTVGLFNNSQSVAQQQDSMTPLKDFMKPKLTHAQRILDGLATENFQKILESSSVLMTLSEAASWQVLPGPQYTQNTSDFQRAVEKLQAAARKKNVDAATIAYINMTTCCIHCHQAIRHPDPEQKPLKKRS